MLTQQPTKGTMFVLSAIILITQTFAGLATATEYNLIETYTVGAREPSGLAYDPTDDTLWVVEDRGGGIYKIQKRGEDILGAIVFTSEDLEGIAYNPSSKTFFLAEERKRFILEIDKKGTLLKTIDVPIEYDKTDVNNGFEGVTFDPASKHLFVVNEKNPVAVLEVTHDAEIVNSFEVDVKDLSGICLDNRTGNLLVISHESQMVMEFTKDGKLVSSFMLDVSKPEGIAIDNDGLLYIICEETQHLYVYQPR
ncbi:MAG: SdiA-regulated domain-containing protein [Candidatus Brocadiales bacterium]